MGAFFVSAMSDLIRRALRGDGDQADGERTQRRRVDPDAGARTPAPATRSPNEWLRERVNAHRHPNHTD